VAWHPERLGVPLRRRKPAVIGVDFMSDLFHPSTPNEQIAAVFGVMAATPQHVYLLATKRPRRARGFSRWIKRKSPDPWTHCHSEALRAELMSMGDGGPLHTRSEEASGRPWPLPNVVLLASIEGQATANERIPLLLQCPAAVHGVRVEPMLWRLEFGAAAGIGFGADLATRARLAWVICGGESGPGARPMHPDWARRLRDQAIDAGLPFFFKQWGPSGAGRELDGREWTQVPRIVQEVIGG